MRRRLYHLVTEPLNRLVALLLLAVFVPLIVVLAIAVRVDSPGSVFIRCRRVGQGGREFDMLKFRKMFNGAGGPALTSPVDERLTRLGRVLAKYKLDELPQLWNVLRGQMNLIGPRPEDPAFVELHQPAYSEICTLKPGVTCLSQLAFARESEILDPDNRVADYVGRVLPQKLGLDRLYAERRSLAMDARILIATIFVTVFRGEVAVDRTSGRLTIRHRSPLGSGIQATVAEATVVEAIPVEATDVARG